MRLGSWSPIDPWDPDSHWTSCARHLPASQQGPRFTLDFSRPAWASVLLPVLFPFVPKSVPPWSRDPGRAPKCSVCSLSPRSGKKTPWSNATCNRGIYYWFEPGPPALTKGVRMKGPEPQFSRVFIRSKKQQVVGTSGLVTQQVVGASRLVTQLQGSFSWGFQLSPGRFPFSY